MIVPGSPLSTLTRAGTRRHPDRIKSKRHHGSIELLEVPSLQISADKGGPVQALYGVTIEHRRGRRGRTKGGEMSVAMTLDDSELLCMLLPGRTNRLWNWRADVVRADRFRFYPQASGTSSNSNSVRCVDAARNFLRSAEVKISSSAGHARGWA